MDFAQSEKSKHWMDRVQRFMDENVYPAIPTFRKQNAEYRWSQVPPILVELQAKAKQAGLWNMFMPASEHEDAEFHGVGLTNLEYAPIAEVMGRVHFGSEVFNCMAPDTGNMEVLIRYGTHEQKQRFLKPLMNAETRSAFLMTEPAVASSDARNIQTEIRRDGDSYVINGHKWWSSLADHPLCDFFILMGKTDPTAPTYRQQSMILVPRDTPGIEIVRPLTIFNYDHAPRGHYEVKLKNVRVPAANMILGEGRGFEIAQGRLGPGRIHHAMRVIAYAEVALEKMCKRLLTRTAFGKKIAEHSVWEQRIAEARIDIEMARLLCLKTAYMMDTVGNKVARAEIAMIKVAAPRIALKVIDDAIQAHGGAGLSEDFGLAELYANTRLVRITDGPDEVHCRQISHIELAKYR
ncbi:MAG TPA: acyl-CoA dehydrogenase family protein [Ramlibacter sp.]|nr:acyl-CoA dehydrogenase family protein [Ramlibacter sp.]